MPSRPHLAPVPITVPAACPRDRPFTWAEARDRGLTADLLSDLVRSGQLRRPVKGVYVHTAQPDDLATRVAALHLVVPPSSFVSDRTAAWLHGATTALAPGDHLTVPALDVQRLPDRTRLRNTLVSGGRRAVRDDDLCQVGGLAVTTPLRTALDLGRLQRRDLALAGMDALAAAALVSPDALMAEVERFRGERGVVQLRALAPLVDPGAASPGESALRLRWHDAGLPRPVCQVTVARPDGRTFVIDLGLPESRFGAEYDGEAFHGPDRAVHDAARRTWLRGVAGWHVEVFRAADTYGPGQDATDRLARAWHEHRRAA